MKKILLTSLISGMFVFSYAQTLTSNFEGWNGTGANEQPNGWITGNILVGPFFPGNTQSVFKAVAPDVHGGTYAMQITTVDVVTNPDATSIPDPYGLAIAGAVTFVPSLSLKPGFPYTSRPATAEFWYKYAPSGADTAGFLMWLTKWNGTRRDTVATGYWETNSSASAYTLNSVTLFYNPLLPYTLPDTAGVNFSATGIGCMTCGNVGSTLWIDDIVFSGWVGINEHPSSEGVIVYPNPASEFVNISVDADEAFTVVVYDAVGKMVASSPFSESTNAINKKAGTIYASNFVAGLYSYSVIDKNGTFLRRGKFNVVK
ncbi:MAG: T9SS type A sorting domain-containing protein [Bacteroidota bacterium]